MAQLAHLWGLPTLNPSTKQVGAALSVGIKPKGGGWPTEKDRFHIVESSLSERTERGRKVEYRKYDRRFSPYNKADLEVRKVFYGMLCYHQESECWHPNYMMHRAPKGRGITNPRSKRPACVGNGVEAQRWNGEDYDRIACPGEGCPFRQPQTNGKGQVHFDCMPRARFWFMPRWLPSQGVEFARRHEDGRVEQLLERPIMRLATQGRQARDTFAGMLEDVRRQARDIFEIRSWYGLPFTINLSQGTNAEKKTRWPDITFTLGGDWMAWLQWQSAAFKELSEAPQVLQLGSASDDELDADAVGAEHLAIVPTVDKPAAVACKPEAVEPITDDALEKLADRLAEYQAKTPTGTLPDSIEDCWKVVFQSEFRNPSREDGVYLWKWIRKTAMDELEVISLQEETATG